VKLVMIGTDVDGRALASRHAVHLGPVVQRDLLDAYDACDVLVLPSEHESFGMVFLEAWMRGKPVIGNRLCGPVASLIRHGQDGFLCADAQDIAERIVQLVADPQLARALGAAGRARVAARYTWEAIGRKVHAVYEDVARGARGRGGRPDGAATGPQPECSAT
jgi:glycosyltransferase involved in cell wall biosynthesis